MTPTSGIEVKQLRAAYDRGVEILRGVDMSAAEGRISLIIGPNGAGKSTLLKTIAGMVPVTGGEILYRGEDVVGESTEALLRRGMGFVPQESSVFREMTVRENLQLGGWSRRKEKQWLEERIEVVCELFPVLAERVRDYAGELSGGQQKLLEIARTLICDPSVLLLDEPTAPLAPGMARLVYEEIARLNAELGITILLVDQNVRQGLDVSHDVYVLFMGQNDVSGPAPEIAERLDSIVAGWMNRRQTEEVSG